MTPNMRRISKKYFSTRKYNRRIMDGSCHDRCVARNNFLNYSSNAYGVFVPLDPGLSGRKRELINVEHCRKCVGEYEKDDACSDRIR